VAKDRIVGVAVAPVLALALFFGGALGPFASGSDEPAEVGSRGSVADQLAPGRIGDAAADIASLRDTLKERPDDPRAHALLGFAFLRKARAEADPTAYLGAQASFERSLEVADGASFEATLGTAVLAGSRHDFDAAARWARRAALLNPHSSLALGVEGDALLELGRIAAAEATFQKAVDLRPDLASYARASYARQARGDTQGALRFMNLSARSTVVGEDAAWANSQIGEIHIGAGDFTAAARAFRRAHALAPDFYLPDVGRAHVAFARGHLKRAIAIQRSVVRRFPQPSFVAELGDLLWVAGRRGEAERLYRRAERLLELYFDNGVQIDVEMPVFFADRRRDPRRALRMARSLYRNRRGQAAADALAWASWASRRYEAAERHIREAMREGPESPDVLFHAGMIAAARGDTTAARARLRRALHISAHWSFRDSTIARGWLRRN
jgi:tetratricopeptide (TPR) repeat protein